MLTLRQGDLFAHAKAPCIIAHGVNAQGKMGAGFARQLRLRLPEAYVAYRAWHEEERLTVGELLIVVCGSIPRKKIHVCHCVTQEFYGRDPERVYVDYAAVEHCLSEVALYARKVKLPVHLPVIGGGHAHGDRARLFSIFRRTLDGVQTTVWVDHLPESDPTTSEPAS